MTRPGPRIDTAVSRTEFPGRSFVHASMILCFSRNSCRSALQQRRKLGHCFTRPPVDTKMSHFPARADARKDATVLAKGVSAVAVASLALALLVPSSKQMPFTLRLLSDAIGFAYTAAWSYSFYPQALQNYRRRCDILGGCDNITDNTC